MRRTMTTLVTCLLVLGAPLAAGAQQTLSDALSFLLINRTVATGDFTRDEAAAAATRDTLTAFMLAELNTLPTASPAGGFTYRLDPEFGISVRSSTHFGPFFVERSLTSGRGRASIGIAFNDASFNSIDGRDLRDGSLIATAGRLAGDSQPFDAETLTLAIRTRAVTVSGHAGITDRLDLNVAVPFVTVSLDGRRIDTYRGTAILQAAADGSVSGVGDVRVGAKYNAFRRGGSGLAVAAEARLPTGDSDNLLGGGEFVFAPHVAGSLERAVVAVHGDVGYASGGRSNEFRYAGALTIAATNRLTVSTELIGRRLSSGGKLVHQVTAHPSLIGVETIRLSGTEDATNRLHLGAGLRWNVASQWLVNLSVLKPLTTAGLNGRWISNVSLDYALGN